MTPFVAVILRFCYGLQCNATFRNQALRASPTCSVRSVLTGCPRDRITGSVRHPIIRAFRRAPAYYHIQLRGTKLISTTLHYNIGPFDALATLLYGTIQTCLSGSRILCDCSASTHSTLNIPGTLCGYITSFRHGLPLATSTPLTRITINISTSLGRGLSTRQGLFHVTRRVN